MARNASEKSPPRRPVPGRRPQQHRPSVRAAEAAPDRSAGQHPTRSPTSSATAAMAATVSTATSSGSARSRHDREAMSCPVSSRTILRPGDPVGVDIGEPTRLSPVHLVDVVVGEVVRSTLVGPQPSGPRAPDRLPNRPCRTGGDPAACGMCSRDHLRPSRQGGTSNGERADAQSGGAWMVCFPRHCGDRRPRRPLPSSGSMRKSALWATFTRVPVAGSASTTTAEGTPRDRIAGTATRTAGTWRTTPASVTTATRAPPHAANARPRGTMSPSAAQEASRTIREDAHRGTSTSSNAAATASWGR